MTFKNILFISKRNPASLPYIKEICEVLKSKGYACFCNEERKRFFDGLDLTPIPENDLKRIDLAVIFGGDGSILKAAKYLVPNRIPIFGVNMGTVGYLPVAEPEDALKELLKILSGDYVAEKRTVLSVDSLTKRFIAINEAVVYRGTLGHIITLQVKVDGTETETVRADGIIVATPTGSTAYNLSAGGPIVAPRSGVIIITPICAHSLSVRPIIVSDNATIEVIASDFRSDEEKPSLDVDGRSVAFIPENGRITVTAAKTPLTLLTTRPRNFFRVLKTKLSQKD